MKRPAALAAVFAVAAAGVVVVAVPTGTDHAAVRPGSLQEVVARVGKEFGDHRIVRAKIDGSRLHVILAPAKQPEKGNFEASVLSAAVADWMRSHGRKPIERVRWFGGGNEGGRLEGEPVPTAPAGSVSRDSCESAARSSLPHGPQSVFARVSVTWLPYLHGTCVVRLQTLPDAAWSNVPAQSFQAVGSISRAIGEPEFAFYFEVDDDLGAPLLGIARVGAWGSNWSTGAHGIPSPFAHG